MQSQIRKVGKTTTTGNLGIGMAKRGKRVLLIDADAQGSLTASLGYTEPDRLEVMLATIMERIVNEDYPESSEGILHHKEGVDLLPANIELSGIEVSLVNIMSRETVRLNDILEKQEEELKLTIQGFDSLKKEQAVRRQVQQWNLFQQI